MNLKKNFYIYLYISIAAFFFSCEDDDGGSNLGDAVGTWNLQSLNATYDRTVVTKPESIFQLMSTILKLLGKTLLVMLQKWLYLKPPFQHLPNKP